MKILGLIPARGGSKGIPRKNIKLLGGLPLLAWTAKSAKDSIQLCKTIISTDDEKIAQVAASYDIEVPFLRPGYLAKDDTPTLPVILHALEFFQKRGEEFDAVCLLQTTSPLRGKGFIDLAIDKFISGNADALISVRIVPHEFNPHWVFEPDENDNLSIATGERQLITQRQLLPPAYIRDGAIYITKVSVLKNQKSLYGNKLAFILNNDDYHINLDTIRDWEIAESILQALNRSDD